MGLGPAVEPIVITVDRQATAAYLRSCGAYVDELRVGELGVHGNGHAMMLEKNNAEIAALITDWIVEHT